MNQKEINIQDSVDEVNLNKSYGVVQNFAIDFLKTKINENLFYPVRAKQRKISGTVELKIAVDENGLLKLCKIHKTSDSLILDNAATELVQNIFPIDKNFSDLPFEKIILIEYKLN
jgi:TonB family protein